MLDIVLKKNQGRFRLDIAISAPKSGITAIYDPSGAGKSSIINMIAGLSMPDEGHILINGIFLYNRIKKINLAPEWRQIGYVFQDSRLFPHLSVLANLKYGLKRVAPQNRFLHLDQIVPLLRLETLLDRMPAKLSGGEKQRVAIGRALLVSPRLLLMDEPLSSLDTSCKQEILPFIRRLAKELTIPILYVTHARSEIKYLAQKVIMVSNGKTLAAVKEIQEEDSNMTSDLFRTGSWTRSAAGLD